MRSPAEACAKAVLVVRTSFALITIWFSCHATSLYQHLPFTRCLVKCMQPYLNSSAWPYVLFILLLRHAYLMIQSEPFCYQAFAVNLAALQAYIVTYKCIGSVLDCSSRKHATTPCCMINLASAMDIWHTSTHTRKSNQHLSLCHSSLNPGPDIDCQKADVQQATHIANVTMLSNSSMRSKVLDIWPYLCRLQANNLPGPPKQKPSPAAGFNLPNALSRDAQAAVDLPAFSYSMTQSTDVAGWLDSNLLLDHGIFRSLTAQQFKGKPDVFMQVQSCRALKIHSIYTCCPKDLACSGSSASPPTQQHMSMQKMMQLGHHEW